MRPERVKEMDRKEQVFVRFGRIAFWLVILASVVAFMPLSAKADPVPYVELGVGYNSSFFGQSDAHDWDDGGAGPFGATIEAGVEWDIPNNPNLTAKCRWLHVSQWTVGPPFNDKAESSLDHVGCSAKWRFK